MDLDAFFCSVEELQNPYLKGKPFAVGGQAGKRGVISTASYAARRYGVHSAMPTGRAMRLCPDLILVSSGNADYVEYSKRVMDIVCDFTPLVQKLSIDEAFLDVSDLPETPLQIARSLQSRINNETRLPCSIGGATNMLVAKIANNCGKGAHKAPNPPNAITIVEPGREREFLAPLPVSALWGVGPKTAERFQTMGFKTIGDIALRTSDELERLFGRNGRELYERALGIDDRPIEVEREVKSVSQEITFTNDVNDRDVLTTTIKRLSSKVASQLRKKGFSAKTVRIKIRWASFETHTRQTLLNQATNHDSIISQSAIELFNGIWPEGKKVRLIGVGTSQLTKEPVQTDLFDRRDEKEERLLRSVDALRERFGSKIVFRGYEIKKEPDSDSR